jgi:hypothetical protein
MSSQLDVKPSSALTVGVIQSDTVSASPRPDVDTEVHLSTKMQQDATLLQLLAENCYLKLTLCKNRQEQHAIIANYTITFSQLNDDPRRHARAYLEAEMDKHGVSRRTLLRMLPTELKDYSKRMIRLGKTMTRKEAVTEEGAAAIIMEPD